MDDTIKKLGTIRQQDEGRDAIHIAVLTMQATDSFLVLGKQYVNKYGRQVSDADPTAIGIVDPFLPDGIVKAGQWFYVYLKPATVTGLQHVWKHPEFQDVSTSLPTPALPVVVSPVPTVDVVDRVSRFCLEAGIDYDDFIEVLSTGRSDRTGDSYSNYTNQGEYILSNGTDMYGDIPSGILDDVERIIGTKLKYRPTHFSCAC